MLPPPNDAVSAGPSMKSCCVGDVLEDALLHRKLLSSFQKWLAAVVDSFGCHRRSTSAEPKHKIVKIGTALCEGERKEMQVAE